jgi:hypothetical protein
MVNILYRGQVQQKTALTCCRFESVIQEFTGNLYQCYLPVRIGTYVQQRKEFHSHSRRPLSNLGKFLSSSKFVHPKFQGLLRFIMLKKKENSCGKMLKVRFKSLLIRLFLQIQQTLIMVPVPKDKSWLACWKCLSEGLVGQWSKYSG